MKNNRFRIKSGQYLIMALLTCICCSKPAAGPTEQAVINKITGSVYKLQDDKKIPVQPGEKLYTGESVVTEKDGVAVISLNHGKAQLELQENSEMNVDSYDQPDKILRIARGSVWTHVEKLSQNQSFTVKTPAQVCGVRGTKFYNFEFNGVTATCFCQGAVAYEQTRTKYSATVQQDHIIASRDGITVTITPEELAAIGAGHNHSHITGSPLGPQPPNKEAEKVKQLIIEKITAAQNNK